MPPKLATVVNRQIENLLNLWGPSMLWDPTNMIPKGQENWTLHPITYPHLSSPPSVRGPKSSQSSSPPSVVHLKKLGQSCFENLLFLEKSWSGSNSVFIFSLFSVFCVFENLWVFLLLLFLHLVLCFWTCGCILFFWELGVGSRKLKMRGSQLNLVTAVIGFGMSATFIVFVCTRIICGRLRRAESRPMFEIESRIDLEQVLFKSLCWVFHFWLVTGKTNWLGICFILWIYATCGR